MTKEQRKQFNMYKEIVFWLGETFPTLYTETKLKMAMKIYNTVQNSLQQQNTDPSNYQILYPGGYGSGDFQPLTENVG